MKSDGPQSRAQQRAGAWLDLLLAILLLAAGLAVRWPYTKAVVFPPLDDPAFYLTTGGNLLAGRGLEIDALWSYQIPFPNATHPSHEHWMPAATGLIAAAFAIAQAVSDVVESTLRTGQLPSLILGALLVPFTYVVGRRILPEKRRSAAGFWKGNRWVALGAALLIAANATLSYQSASADSSAAYALIAAWALAIAVRQPGDRGSYLGAGLVIGLAYLTRSDGLLLLLALPLAWFSLPSPARSLVGLPENPAAQAAWDYWPREQGSEESWQRVMGPSLANLLDLVVGFALVVAPWLVRNYLAFGTPLPSSVLSQAWLTDYVETFNYWSQPSMETFLAQGWPAILAQRLQALVHNGGVFLLVTFLWGLLALPGFWLLRREWPFWPPLVYGMLLFFVLALVFPVSSMSGTFYHSVGALLPFLALASAYAVQRGAQRLARKPGLSGPIYTAVMIGFVILAGAQVLAALPTVAERHQAEKEQFEAAEAWLSQNAAAGDVVMTSQPYTLNYASGHPCIVLPGGEPPDAAWEAAQQYGARYLIITQTFGQYPQVFHDQPDPRFRLLEATETTEFYEISRGEP